MKDCVPPLCDPVPMTIQRFQDILKRLGKEYGVNAVLSFDAGYNNISCFVEKEKSR